jgi:hypothetical protein
METTVRVQVRLPISIAEQLRLVCKVQGVSVAEVMSTAATEALRTTYSGETISEHRSSRETLVSCIQAVGRAWFHDEEAARYALWSVSRESALLAVQPTLWETVLERRLRVASEVDHHVGA